jgi:hypothetical protein
MGSRTVYSLTPIQRITNRQNRYREGGYIRPTVRRIKARDDVVIHPRPVNRRAVERLELVRPEFKAGGITVNPRIE